MVQCSAVVGRTGTFLVVFKLCLDYKVYKLRLDSNVYKLWMDNIKPNEKKLSVLSFPLCSPS